MQARTWAANASLISIRSMSSSPRPAASSARRIAGTGPIPMYAGSTPATPIETIRARGRAPIDSARSLRGEHQAGGAVVEGRGVAGRHRAALAERRPQPRQLLERGVGARALVGGDHDRVAAVCRRRLHRHQLVGEPPLGARGDRAGVALEREAILLVARDPVALGDVLGRLAHRLGRVALRHPRVDQAPPERRVVHRLRPARQPGLRLRHHPRGAAHGLRAAGQVEVALAEAQGARGLVDRLQARGAEPVHGYPRDLRRQAGQKRRHPGGVAVVLARLVGGAQVDVADRRRVDAGSLHRLREHVRGEVVRPHPGERPAVTAHRRANGVDDQSVYG